MGAEPSTFNMIGESVITVDASQIVLKRGSIYVGRK